MELTKLTANWHIVKKKIILLDISKAKTNLNFIFIDLEDYVLISMF